MTMSIRYICDCRLFNIIINQRCAICLDILDLKHQRGKDRLRAIDIIMIFKLSDFSAFKRAIILSPFRRSRVVLLRCTTLLNCHQPQVCPRSKTTAVLCRSLLTRSSARPQHALHRPCRHLMPRPRFLTQVEDIINAADLTFCSFRVDARTCRHDARASQT